MKLILFLASLLILGRAHGATLLKEKSDVDQASAKTSASILDEEVVTDSTVSSTTGHDGGNLADAIPAAASSVSVVAKGDGDYIIRYPTTPEPDENTPTAPPPDLVPDDISPPQRMSEQKIITGNADCACGRPKTRIINGENATINDLPWTVALMRKKSDGTIRGPYCGGTLICDRYVATASHCVDGFEADGIQVWLFEENFQVEDENAQPTIKMDVAAITMHPDYDRKKIDNDIALLRLASPVKINADTDSLTPACVPADNENTYEGEDATVAGWGATEMGGDVSPNLQKVTVPVFTNKQCNWRSLYLGKITENMLCAGDLASGGKDSCQGDSGGPLVVPRNNKFLLVGIVSFGYGCAQPLAPGVYTRVGRYPEWIQATTADCEYCSA